MKTRTVGVEEEFLLFAADQPELVELGPDVVRSADRATADSVQFEKELKKAQVELATAPATNLGELTADLIARRAELIDAAREHGARLVACGTSPVPNRAATTEHERYQEMAERFAAIEDQELTCAMHVHVQIESDDEGVMVLDQIAPWLPVLTALSSNSPFHSGRDTGYASYRTIIWGRWPTAGPTGAFAGAAEYHALVDGLIGSGAARDKGMIYFDARLSDNYPTVEIRVCDVCIDPEDATLLAALCRGLVATAAQSGRRAQRVRPELQRAAAWRAARWGMAGELVDVTKAVGSGGLAPAWELAEALVDQVSTALASTGDLAPVRAGLDRIRRRGTGAEQQRSSGDPVAAVDRATLRERQ